MLISIVLYPGNTALGLLGEQRWHGPSLLITPEIPAVYLAQSLHNVVSLDNGFYTMIRKHSRRLKALHSTDCFCIEK